MTRVAAARLVPPPLEIAVHYQIADLLAIAIAPGWVWWHTPNGEYRTKATAGRLKRMGVKPGVSDFLLVSPYGGKLHALELKREGAHPTADQHAFLCAVDACGGRSDWTDSFEHGVSILRSWGAIRVKS